MKTLLSSTATKYISTRPLYSGDLGNNMGLYDRVPDFSKLYWKQLHSAAEKYNYDRSESNWAYHKQAMFYCAMSSGRDAMVAAIENPKRVIEYSQILDPKSDQLFLTTQRIADVLDGHQIDRLMSANSTRNMVASAYAADQNPDLFITGPAHREAFLRGLSKVPSLTRSATFPDEVFETHLWVPYCLLEATHGIYYGDHAWSRNACPEKATGLAIQYGVKTPLMARLGHQFDVIDIKGRAVPLVDQAWEDARALVDFCRQNVVIDSQQYDMRNEPLAALLVLRFAYDQMWLDHDDRLDQQSAHYVIQAHYDDLAESEKMNKLKSLMIPYLKAKASHWPALQAILDNDDALKSYWHAHVAKAADLDEASVQSIEDDILSYLPRGGFECADLNACVTTRRDPVSIEMELNLASMSPRQEGLTKDPFSTDYDSKIFDDQTYQRLGGSQQANVNHLTFDQAALSMTLPALLSGGIAPHNQERVMIYLDAPHVGLRSQHFVEGLGQVDARELNTMFDALSAGSQTLSQQVSKENAADFSDMILRLMKDKQYKPWRDKLHLGNIVPASSMNGLLDRYSNYRESTDTYLYQSISAQGSGKPSSAAKECLTRYMIKLGAQGIIMPSGRSFEDKNYRYIVEGTLAALGLQGRMYSGGKYQFEFFEDDSYYRAPSQSSDPKKLDFLDLFISMGMEAKSSLQADQPQNRRDLYVSMMRMVKFYEMITRASAHNHVADINPQSEKGAGYDIIDFANIADKAFIASAVHGSYSRTQTMAAPLTGMPYKRRDDSYVRSYMDDPIFQAFNADDLDIDAYKSDPIKKAELANMLYFWMRKMPMTNPSMDGDLPFTGALFARGVHCVDVSDFKDLDQEYFAARDQWMAMSERDRQALFETDIIHLDPAAVPFRHGQSL